MLLVDDELAFLHRAGLALTVLGFNVHVSGSTEEALEMVRARAFDLIVSADEMLELSGHDFLAEAAQLRPDARRILTTRTPAGSALDAAVHRQLTRPLPVETLSAVIVELLGEGAAPPKPDTAVGHRRSQLLQSLEEAYPGLQEVAAGAHLPQTSAEFAALRRLAQSTLDGGAKTEERLGFGQHLESFDPKSLADDLLVLAIQMPGTTISVEPGSDAHTILFETGTRSIAVVTLPSALGDSLAARLALVAQLDLAAVGHQSGSIVVDYDSLERPVAIALRTSSMGLGIELRCDAPPPATQEAAPATIPAPAPAAHDAPHDELVPGYRLLEPLGEGGVGIVYRAVHLVLETPVAIKLLLPSEAAQPQSAVRMMREARAASRSKHPAIVAVLDCGRLPDQRAYIIMELVESPTLDRLLESRGALPVADAVKIARRVAEALETAHDVGVVHRDIKPSNIFVNEVEGIIKLSDFGAAQMVDDAGPNVTGDHLTVGTPHYMSPEQARTHRVDRRTDIYALGCVLYEMICGHTPYSGNTALDVIAQHVLSPVPTAASPLGPLPLALTRVLRRALSKNPGERHQTARELIGDLDSATSSVQRTGWRRWLP